MDVSGKVHKSQITCTWIGYRPTQRYTTYWYRLNWRASERIGRERDRSYKLEWASEWGHAIEVSYSTILLYYPLPLGIHGSEFPVKHVNGAYMCYFVCPEFGNDVYHYHHHHHWFNNVYVMLFLACYVWWHSNWTELLIIRLLHSILDDIGNLLSRQPKQHAQIHFCGKFHINKMRKLNS